MKSMVISEDASVDYSQIHNCVEVWGASNSSDYFCKDKLEETDPDGTGEVVYCKKGTKEWDDVVALIKNNELNVSYNMNPDNTGASILWLKLKQASISDGTKFSFVCPEDVAIDARVCIENLITTIKTNPDGKGEYKDVSRAVYGEIVRTDGGGWTTTGEKRTGCVFCAFGAHLEKAPNRFQRLKITHPKLWDYCMRPWEEHGLGMRQVLEYIGIPVE